MSPRKFDRFMVDVHIASNPKLARLTVQERWCHVAGILSLAALSPVRGCLLVGTDPAGPEDIARRAGVPVAVARSTIAKLRKVGVLEVDQEYECDCVHDFEDWNPAPKTDRTNADRQRRYRDRHNAGRNGSVTAVTSAAVTPPEVEVEGKGRETPPRPPASGGRKRDRDRYEGKLAEFCAEHFPGVPAGLVNQQADSLRQAGVEPTVEALRPLIERWHPTVEAPAA